MKGKGAKGKRRGNKRRARVPRSMNPLRTDVASCKDTLGQIGVTANTPYVLQNIALTNSSRAKTIAQGYQFYRISKVEVKWKPYLDTFASTSTLTVPNLYYMIDKSNTFGNNATLDTLKQAGAKAVRFDDKIITRSFAPAVQLASSDAGAGPSPLLETAGVLKVSPWLTTSANAGKPGPWVPNSVDHRGMIFFVEQTVSNPQAGLGSVEVIIHYQFKKPLWGVGSAQETVHRIDLDTLTVVPPPLPTS